MFWGRLNSGPIPSSLEELTPKLLLIVLHQAWRHRQGHFSDRLPGTKNKHQVFNLTKAKPCGGTFLSVPLFLF
jgi:hypothetical protein